MGNKIDYTVTINELFSFEPFLECYCLGGWSGKEKIINQVMELKDFDDSFSEGLLLTINLNLVDIGNIPLHFDSSLAGILMFGEGLPSSLSEIVKGAEQFQVPILHSPLEDAFIEANSLWTLILGLKRSSKFRQFARNTIYYYIKGKSQAELLDYLENRTNNPTVIVNNAFKVISTSKDIETDSSNYISTLLRMIYEREKKSFMKEELIVPGQHKSLMLDDGISSVGYINSPLYHEGYHYGFMITFELNNLISAVDQIYLEETKKIILEQMVSRRNLEEIEKKYKTDFIHDLLFNNFESKEDVINRGKHWDFDLSIAHQLYVLEPDNKSKMPEETISKIQRIMFEILAYKFQPIVGKIQDWIVVIIPQSYFKEDNIDRVSTIALAEKFQVRLESCVPKLSYSIGIGRFYPSITDLCRSFQEAKLALELGKLMHLQSSITHFEDLGVMRLLANIDFFQLDDYYKEYLHKILAYDGQNESNLLDTLTMYFKYNGDINTVAQRMYIHANSLRYRLKKIEELTKTDLKNYEDILNLFIATKIAMMYGQGTDIKKS